LKKAVLGMNNNTSSAPSYDQAKLTNLIQALQKQKNLQLLSQSIGAGSAQQLDDVLNN
jgi:polysaccharide deacetylase 2 family uncharacterized protein YibQ